MTEQVEDFPRDEAHRFRLYCMARCDSCGGSGRQRNWSDHAEKRRCPTCRGEGRQRSLLAATPDAEGLGLALVTLGREGAFYDCQGIGILDVLGPVGSKWLVKPWTSSPRNISDAGRVLASGRKANDA